MTTRRFTGTGRVRTSHEVVSKLDGFLTRLRVAGATPAEVDDFRAIWDEPEGWLIPRDTLAGLADGDLRRLLDWHRTEHYRHTHDENEEADDVRRARYAAAIAEWAAADQPLRVAEVTEWVGADPVRAAVALDHELGMAEGDRRVTLLRFLEPIADPEPRPDLDDDDDGVPTVDGASPLPGDESNGISL